MVEFDRIIPPGQEGKISIEIKERTRPGPFVKNITVKSNAPGHETEKLIIKTHIYKLLEIMPRDSIYMTGFRGETAEQTLTVTNRHDEAFKILGINVDNPHVRVTLLKNGEPLEEVNLEPEETVDLRIETLESIPIGRLKGTVKLHTDNAQIKDAEVNIRGVIRHHIMLSPSHVRFLFYGTENVVREREVRVVEKGDSSFRITDISTTDPNVEVETVTEREGKQYMLNLKYTRVPQKEGTQRGIIVIRTDDEELPELNLPFSVTLKTLSGQKPGLPKSGRPGSADQAEGAASSQE